MVSLSTITSFPLRFSLKVSPHEVHVHSLYSACSFLSLADPVFVCRLSVQNTTDAIGRAAAEAMQGPIQAAYKEAFQSIVLPVFERGCQSMFQQINDSFKQGTHECKGIVTNLLDIRDSSII